MRVDGIQGLYLQYKDIASPVENIDRVVYSFPKQKDRTCLVSNPIHIEILLKTGKYRVIAVEVEAAAPKLNGDLSRSDVTAVTETKSEETKSTETNVIMAPKRKPGRPPKRRG